MTSRTPIGASVSLRVVIIALLALTLLVPVGMITALVRERQHRSEEAVAEVTSKWAGAQTIGGPVLTIPYQTRWKDEKGQDHTGTEYIQILPQFLSIQGGLDTFTRMRGIYKVILYTTRMTFKGAFSLEGLSGLGVPADDIVWRDAFISIGIPDMRGINEAVILDWNGRALLLEPGIREGGSAFESGVSVRVPVGPGNGDPIVFSFPLDLNGSGEINLLPLGKTTEAEISSKWPNPSFDGAFLPKSREVTDAGFSAKWKILDLNRNYPQAWTSKTNPKVLDSRFGVRLFSPVDQYTQTIRAVKYALMFIGLTFLIFFLVEVSNKRRIHPIQYILVGLALCLFYVLLLSLSEHINFALAYLVAGLSNVLLITYYVGSALKSRMATVITALTLAALYGFMYVLLRNQDYALLIGSTGLFLIMAVVMILTRKVDWYGLDTRPGVPLNAEPQEPAGSPKAEV